MGDVDVLALAGAESKVRYHPLYIALLTPSKWGTVPVGQFAWGGSLLKSNGGVQRFA